ncbi:MAG: nucleotide exchange factor GrpE [Aristaeellaceae bacterium]
MRRTEKKRRMNEQELNQQEPETVDQPAVETPVEESPAEAEVIDVAALTAAAAKADEYLALAQRTQADFDNFRRRNESVRADAYADGQRTVALAMLAVLDNLERALMAPAAEGDPLRTGVEMTLKQMLAAYEKLGVTVIDRVGEKFDPNQEDAVMQGSSEEGEPGTVCAVFQKGYKMGDHLLRPAMVKVVAE